MNILCTFYSFCRYIKLTILKYTNRLFHFTVHSYRFIFRICLTTKTLLFIIFKKKTHKYVGIFQFRRAEIGGNIFMGLFVSFKQFAKDLFARTQKSRTVAQQSEKYKRRMKDVFNPNILFAPEICLLRSARRREMQLHMKIAMKNGSRTFPLKFPLHTNLRLYPQRTTVSKTNFV